MTPSTIIFLGVTVLCIGAAIGAALERLVGKRSKERPTPTVSPNTLAQPGDVQVLSAWRSLNSQVWLEMDGKRMDGKEALQPEQRQRLLNLVLDLRPWLDAARPIQPRPAVPVQAPQPEKDKKPSNKKGVPPPPVLDTIIQQIDKVLQAKLLTSDLKGREIELTEGPGGVVIVKDGVNTYEGIDTIPDPQVKDLIRQAVMDWEKGSK
jgi:hypothetical protein